MSKALLKGVLAGVIAVLGFFLITAANAAPRAEDFFKGKVIELVVDAPAGTGPDANARLIKPYFDQYTGGSVVVKNLGGAGGMEGDNYVWRAKPDGLTIGLTTFSAIAMTHLLNDPGALYKIDKLNYLGGLGRESDVFFVKADGPIKSIQDLKGMKGIKFVGLAPTHIMTINLEIVAYCLDLDAKVATGFSAGEGQMAVVQGTSPGFISSPGTYLNNVSRGWKGLFLIDTHRHPALQDMPTLPELVQLPKDKLELVEVRSMIHAGRAVFLPPGVPEDRVAFLQKGFQQMVKDENFRGMVQKLFGYKDVPCPDAKETLNTAKNLVTKQKYIQEKIQFLSAKYGT